MSVERINNVSTGTGRLRRAEFDIVADTSSEIDEEIGRFQKSFPPEGYTQSISDPHPTDDGRISVHVKHSLSCD